MGSALRVIHCGTGLAGKEALGAVIERDDLELMALLVHSEANEGRDAAEFAGSTTSTGIRGTRDKEALFTLAADIVIYMMLIPSLDDICRFLAAGKNVVTTSGFMFGVWNDPESDGRIKAACEEGQSSFYVSGVNPGFADEILPLTMSVLSRNWKSVRIKEYADCSKYPHQGILEIMGFGYTPEDIAAGNVAEMETMVKFFEASVAALAHGLGADLDEIRQTREFKMAETRLDIGALGTIEAGTVAGQRWRWTGIKDGEVKVSQETYWIVAFDLGEGWPKSGEMDGDTRWEVTIEGRPSLRCVFDTRETFEEGVAPSGAFNPSGVSTGLAVTNRLHAVVAARPGPLTAHDLPQPRFRG